MFEVIKPSVSGGPHRGRGWLHKYKPALRRLICTCDEFEIGYNRLLALDCNEVYLTYKCTHRRLVDCTF